MDSRDLEQAIATPHYQSDPAESTESNEAVKGVLAQARQVFEYPDTLHECSVDRGVTQ